MKNLQQLFDEVMANEDLKSKFTESAKKGTLAAFAKEHGVEASEDEIKAFISEKSSEDAPLSLNDLANAAGGDCGTFGLSDCHSTHHSACNDC